jgi:hypothetical protein
MRRILLTCALLTVLALPAAAAARLRPAAAAKPGFLVVRQAADDKGVNGRPAVVVVIKGFLLGRISHEARVDVYQLPSAAGQGAVQVKGTDVSTRPITWQPHPSGPTFTGKEYTGSDFRFRAIGGYYRVVVRGSGIYLFAGGQGHVTLRGSSFHPKSDGKFSVDGGTFRSLPKTPLTRKLGGG